MRVCVCVCVYAHESAHEHVCLCFLHAHVRVSMCMRVGMSVGMCPRVPVCLYLSVYMMRASMHVDDACMHLSLCLVCMCVCARVRVCARARAHVCLRTNLSWFCPLLTVSYILCQLLLCWVDLVRLAFKVHF